MSAETGWSYWDRIQDRMQAAILTERAAIEEAAQLLADRMGSGGRVYVYDTGHMLERELIHRAGGLAAWVPFNFGLTITNNLIHHPSSDVGDPSDQALPGFVAYALDASGIDSGDALLLASVTGARKVPVELALQARARGIAVIGVTAPTYAEAVPARHPSGQKLMDVADIVIRNDCVVGDAAIQVPGIEIPTGPTSGVTAAILMWVLCGETARQLAAAGRPPMVLESMNLPGAPLRNRQKADLVEERSPKRTATTSPG